jgi:hypothetical protein
MLRKVNRIKRLPISTYKYVQVRHIYEQGQSPAPSIREYFYYIDHQGMVGEIMWSVAALKIVNALIASILVGSKVVRSCFCLQC